MMVRPTAPDRPAGGAPGPAERFAAHVGVRVVRGEAPPGGCWATATLPGRPWSAAAAGPADPVPTGAVLALIDATAWAAAEASLAAPGFRATLTPAASSVQYGATATGTVTARASVPCEGALVERADERGLLRFSVAVEVVGGDGTRVATATVQWRAAVVPDPSGTADRSGPADRSGAGGHAGGGCDGGCDGG
ncbi:MAG TPA: DUF4442 domain-containing protein [Acidimicrobiales bacterium]